MVVLLLVVNPEWFFGFWKYQAFLHFIVFVSYLMIFKSRARLSLSEIFFEKSSNMSNIGQEMKKSLVLPTCLDPIFWPKNGQISKETFALRTYISNPNF